MPKRRRRRQVRKQSWSWTTRPRSPRSSSKRSSVTDIEPRPRPTEPTRCAGSSGPATTSLYRTQRCRSWTVWISTVRSHTASRHCGGGSFSSPATCWMPKSAASSSRAARRSWRSRSIWGRSVAWSAASSSRSLPNARERRRSAGADRREAPDLLGVLTHRAIARELAHPSRVHDRHPGPRGLVPVRTGHSLLAHHVFPVVGEHQERIAAVEKRVHDRRQQGRGIRAEGTRPDHVEHATELGVTSIVLPGVVL